MFIVANFELAIVMETLSSHCCLSSMRCGNVLFSEFDAVGTIIYQRIYIEVYEVRYSHENSRDALLLRIGTISVRKRNV